MKNVGRDRSVKFCVLKNMDVSEEAEKLKFFNFLKHYDLSQYHDAFLKYGVRRVSHLKHTTDEDLKEIGLQRPEIARLQEEEGRELLDTRQNKGIV